MKMKIEEILEKAFTTGDLATGGLLEPEQAARFVQGIFENAVVSTEARREPMRSNKRQIDKITFGTNVLQKPVAVGTEHTTTTKPTTSKVTLDAQEAIVAIDLGYDALEDSIEGDNIQNTIIDLASRRVSFEFDKLILEGDTAGGSGDYLEILDGIFKQISTNVVDASAALLSSTILSSTVKKMPGEYMQDEGRLRHYVSHKARLDYIDDLASRDVNDAFTRYLIEAKEPAYQGVPVRKVGAISEVDIGAGVLGSQGVMIDPRNIVIGMHRDISWEMERVPRKRIVEITMTMRVDVKLEEELACVRIDNIKHGV